MPTNTRRSWGLVIGGFALILAFYPWRDNQHIRGEAASLGLEKEKGQGSNE
jgi:hypothetical protein